MSKDDITTISKLKTSHRALRKRQKGIETTVSGCTRGRISRRVNDDQFWEELIYSLYDHPTVDEIQGNLSDIAWYLDLDNLEEREKARANNTPFNKMMTYCDIRDLPREFGSFLLNNGCPDIETVLVDLIQMQEVYDLEAARDYYELKEENERMQVRL